MRKPKSPVSAWIVEQRKRHEPPWKSEELATRLGVAESTVRGWESGRAVSDDNLAALERLFGAEAPGRSDQPTGDLATAIAGLTRELAAWRTERVELETRVADLETMLASLAQRSRPDEGREDSQAPHARRRSAGSDR